MAGRWTWRDRFGFPAVVLGLVAWAGPAPASDLTGKWRIEYRPGAVELIDVVQTGSAVATTLHAPDGVPVDVPLEGTFTEGTGLLTLTPLACPLPCFEGLSVQMLPSGDDGNGHLVVGGPPLPGIDAVWMSRCECFDGNDTAGDGCDASCRIEPCFACTGVPSTCTPEADGASCEEGSVCTVGAQCTGGVCGGGTAVSPCVDMTGLWDAHFLDTFLGLSLDAVEAIRQRGTTVLVRDAVSGAAGFLGTIDPATGAFDLRAPNTSILCSFPSLGYDTLTGSAALDGTTFSGSGATVLPTPHACLADTVAVTATRRPCGNLVVDPGEACDDGNVTNGDGCDSNCTLTACGNGIVTGDEQCDDGNTTDGDGCDATCHREIQRQRPTLFCHEVRAPNRPVSVANVETSDRFGSMQTSILRTAHVCNPATVGGVPSAMPDFQAATFALAPGTPFIGGDYRINNRFGPVFVAPQYADLLLTNAVVGGATGDPLPTTVAWGCYRIQYPAIRNFFISIQDAFRPTKTIRIRKPRLLCVPTTLNGAAPPDPDGYLVCYRQVPRLPPPPEPRIRGVAVRTPFAFETLDAGKDDLVCLPSTLEPAPPGSSRRR